MRMSGGAPTRALIHLHVTVGPCQIVPRLH
jgi:hypothetical protein